MTSFLFTLRWKCKSIWEEEVSSKIKYIFFLIYDRQIDWIHRILSLNSGGHETLEFLEKRECQILHKSYIFSYDENLINMRQHAILFMNAFFRLLCSPILSKYVVEHLRESWVITFYFVISSCLEQYFPSLLFSCFFNTGNSQIIVFFLYNLKFGKCYSYQTKKTRVCNLSLLYCSDVFFSSKATAIAYSRYTWINIYLSQY